MIGNRAGKDVSCLRVNTSVIRKVDLLTGAVRIRNDILCRTAAGVEGRFYSDTVRTLVIHADRLSILGIILIAVRAVGTRILPPHNRALGTALVVGDIGTAVFQCHFFGIEFIGSTFALRDILLSLLRCCTLFLNGFLTAGRQAQQHHNCQKNCQDFFHVFLSFCFFFIIVPVAKNVKPQIHGEI